MDFNAINLLILFICTNALYILILIEQKKEYEKEKELLEFDSLCLTLLREYHIQKFGKDKAYSLFDDIDEKANEILAN